jgi:hypothetical protein
MEEFLITPDLSEAIELDGSVPPGVYSARVLSWEKKESQAGAVYLKWTLVIFGAEGDLAKYNNWKVFYNTMTTGKGAGMLKGFYKACMGTDLEGQFAPAKLVESEIAITVEQGKNKDGSPSKYPAVSKVRTLIPF